ncbi:MAG: energy-coupling factor transporter ATPase [Oscillospiraceae bacterium]|jgi:energy-coupling factor transport system ATP-binding protein|nr:energy-coupling factor transporter ATPase [Oscillospiraceae bacterium]
MNEALIQTQNLEFAYDFEESNIPVLKGIDLQIKAGEFIALLGHNGSGKSTLAKHFNALLLPSGGKAFVLGMDTSNEALTYEIRRRVGMVFQNPDNQLVATIVEEDVAFGPENLGIPSNEIRQRVDEALKTVGMYDYREHAPHKLSGGQKQRVAIAGVIAMQPQCIVFDEPTAMLDPSGREEVIETILRLKNDLGIATVLITHYMDEAALADRVIVMDKGEILLDGTPAEVFAKGQQLRMHNLDVPESVEIAEFARHMGIPVPMDALSPSTCAQAIFKAWSSREESEKARAYLRYKEELSANLINSEAEPASSGSVIKIKELSYTYGGGTPFEKLAINNINLSINKGEFIGIIGHTGSGKTTLVQHLNGLIRPQQGSVLLNGTDIWAKPKKIRQVRYQVGLVFQYPEYQLFEETVYKDIAYGLKRMGVDKHDISMRVREAANFAGLDLNLLEKSPFDLSGGEKRRAAIAGVIAMRPAVLVLDEPSAGLDPKGRRELMNQIQSYRRRSGTTVLMVSHSMEEIARFADRVLVMNKGEIAMQGTVSQVFGHSHELVQMGLKVPELTQIFDSLSGRGVPVSSSVYTLNQAITEMERLFAGGAGNA